MCIRDSLETKINGATHVIINISGDISLMDANDAASYVQDLAGENANIIFGAKFDESMTDQASITVIATGLEDVSEKIDMPGKMCIRDRHKRYTQSDNRQGSSHLCFKQ